MTGTRFKNAEPTGYKGVRFLKGRKSISNEKDVYIVEKIINGSKLRYENECLKTCLKKIDMALIKAGKKGLYYIGK